MGNWTRKKIAWAIIAAAVVVICVARIPQRHRTDRIKETFSFSELRERECQKRFIGGSRTADEQIVVISVEGEILDQPDSYYRRSRVEEIIAQLEEAKEDKETKAVILKIDSPGGSIVDTDKIYARLVELKKTRPVVAFLENVAASGGYYLASAADEIVAYPLTLTGNIGAVMFLPDFQELFERKLGVRMRVIKSGRHKDMGSPWRKMSGEEEAILQRYINQGYEQFLNLVISNRGARLKQTDLLKDGRIFSGTEAKEVGLVDDLGDFDRAAEAAGRLAKVKDARIVEYYYRPSLSELFFGYSRSMLSLPAMPTVPKAGLQYLWLPEGGAYGQ